MLIKSIKLNYLRSEFLYASVDRYTQTTGGPVAELLRLSLTIDILSSMTMVYFKANDSRRILTVLHLLSPPDSSV